MTVYSKSLVSPRAVPAAFTVVYTVPAGIVTVIRELAIVTSAGSGPGQINLQIDSGSGAIPAFLDPLPVGQTTRWELRLVMHAGWTVRWKVTNPVGVTSWGSISGYELTA